MKKNISIFLGSILFAVGVYFFLLQHNIAAGGISGIALILSNLFGFNVGTINLILNAIVLTLGAIFISVKFVKRSILSAATVSISLILLEKIFPNTILTDDIILNAVFGPLIISLGMGLIFYNGGSTGSTDVIATIINKYTNIPIHISLFATDFIVIIFSIFVIGFEKSLYAILVIMIQDMALNNVIQGLGRKIAIFVISDKYEEINELLINKYRRGVTLLHAEGGFTGREKKLILTISTNRRYPLIREDILETDDKAFIFTHTISEVFGEGFTTKELG